VRVRELRERGDPDRRDLDDGRPIVDCWRAADMQIFEFGPGRRMMNRNGEEVEVGEVRLHIQSRWRLVDSERILFGRGDLSYPADANIPAAEFDPDERESVLDANQRAWFGRHRAAAPKVRNVAGDRYGGFRVELEGGFVLECFPCDSRRGEYSEHWRLLGHRADGSHFVVTGEGGA
jgi:hypothetical protein